MKRQIATLFQYALTFALAMGLVVSANARIASHNPPDLAQIAEPQQTSIVDHGHDHGHDHDDVVDIADAYHGHPHDIVDHDHTVAVLPQRREANYLARSTTVWIAIASDVSSRPIFDLDRPPRG
tara:strand:- start:21065 stop:21436 length:372 start_codon:yes stop_codon:yes gene_type:complete